MWHMPVHYPGIRNGWIRRIFPGAVGKIVRPVKGDCQWYIRYPY